MPQPTQAPAVKPAEKPLVSPVVAPAGPTIEELQSQLAEANAKLVAATPLEPMKPTGARTEGTQLPEEMQAVLASRKRAPKISKMLSGTSRTDY